MLVDGHFSFDCGPRDHGAVAGYWFCQDDAVDLGSPLAPFEVADRLYVRRFERGAVAAATAGDGSVTFASPCRDVATDAISESHVVPAGDARIFVAEP
jgi:hypothetical protein